MATINHHYLKLRAGYLFPEISRRVAAFAEKNPTAPIIRMGIGDVTEPLPPAIISAMHAAVDELAHRQTFRGYGPEQGYDFLRQAIAKNDYNARHCEIDADEIFVSDGGKCDTGNILDIFGHNNTVAVTDPVYPVYVDTNVMAGHTGPPTASGEYQNLIYLRTTAATDFVPDLPTTRADLIYLCSPNNPTGTAMTRPQLHKWVDYARANQSVIFFDSAYEAFIADESLPHSIYEIPGAREVAIEFRSFSKLAGFTGVRCAYTVVPKSLMGRSSDGTTIPLHQLWTRRHTTKFNGVSYITQRGAEAVYSESGRPQVEKIIAFYMANAAVIRQRLSQLGYQIFGGINAPYVWIAAPRNQNSWDFFNYLLTQAHVVGTPGSGFGAAGEGYLRLSAFNSAQNVAEALDRIAKLA